MMDTFAMYYYAPKDGLKNGISIAKKQFKKRFGVWPIKVVVRRDEYVNGCELPVVCVDSGLQPHCFRMYDIIARQPVTLSGARVCV